MRNCHECGEGVTEGGELHLECGEKAITERDQLWAEVERLKAPASCGVCAGDGKPISGRPCICGGTGREADEIIGLRRRVHDAELQLRETQEVLSSLAFAVYEDIRSTGPFKIQPSRAVKQAMEAAVKLKAITPKGVQ